MGLLGRIATIAKRPFTAIDDGVRASVQDKTRAAVQAALVEFAAVSPEVADLLSGEEVTLEVKIEAKIRLKQKGEA